MMDVVFALAGFVAAVGLVFGTVAFVRGSARLPWRWLSFIVPLILLTAGLATLMSGRDLNAPIDFETGVFVRGGLLVWTQRLASLVLVAGCFEQWMAWLRRRKPGTPRPTTPWLLLIGYLLMWLTSVPLPALLGAEPRITHDYLYAALIGGALLLSSQDDALRTVRIARDALVVFLLLGLVLIPVAMPLMIETNYSQGLIPGLPRLAGLSPHAVSLALLTLVAMICLVASPYQHRAANLAAWGLFGLVLFLAQSKTIWMATVLCLGTMMIARTRPTLIRWATDPSSRSTIALAIGVLMAIALLSALATTAGGLAGSVVDFLSSSRGQEAMTMTGRDVIWKVALDEWANYPIFGYGPGLFGPEHREYIDLPYATHGHNQFVDSLGRTGLLGTLMLTAYLLVLTVESLRLAQRSGGVTVALWLLLMMRSISEVPFDLYSYGPEAVPHFLLLAVIAGCRAGMPSVAATTPAPNPSPTIAAASGSMALPKAPARPAIANPS